MQHTGGNAQEREQDIMSSRFAALPLSIPNIPTSLPRLTPPAPPPPNRFPSSTLHQRDSRNDLFKGYTGGAGSSSRTATASPSRLNPSSSGNYGGGGYNASPSHGLGGSNTTTPGYGNNFRPATPNARGQYSDAVLNELESQNDAQVDGILGKVKILKDVSPLNPPSPPHDGDSADVVGDNTDDNGDWRRDSRLVGAGGQDE